jgi:hypothetical protein
MHSHRAGPTLVTQVILDPEVTSYGPGNGPYRPMYTKELFPLRGHALTEGSREQKSNDCLSVNPNLVAHMSGLHRDCDTIPEMDPPL